MNEKRENERDEEREKGREMERGRGREKKRHGLQLETSSSSAT